jgi:3-oxoacyl-[acyl-carrier protein] reductase
MDLGLTGRVALVAAASSGLGLAVARTLAAEGAHVAICARDPDRLARAHAEIDGCGPGRVRSTSVDLTDDAAVAAWVRDTAAELGALHIVVTNSGGVPHGPVDAFDTGTYREALTGNTVPHVAVTLAALPFLTRAGWGRIVMITSEAVRQPLADTGLSAVARLGVLGFAKGLVHSLGAQGVTVNVLAPGFHRTPALDAQFGEDVEQAVAEVAKGLPLGRVGRAEDFGALAAFLASEQASFVTGTVLLVDGGNTRGLG